MLAAALPEGSSVESTFENALRGLRATGASVSTNEIVSFLAQHGADEGKILATYETLAMSSSDDSVKYLIALILEDERRHHRLLAEMANAIAWGGFKECAQTATPGISPETNTSLLAMTKRLREFEEDDARNLVQLRKRLKPFADTTIWTLIVELLQLDTKKHITILRFLERHQAAR